MQQTLVQKRSELNCCADFGRPLTKKVMSHSRDGTGITAPLQKEIVPPTAVWNPPSLRIQKI